MSINTLDGFNHILKKAKLRLLKLHFDSKCGHIGGNFSCIDAIMTLFNIIMHEDDRFILSKGHSSGSLYIALWSIKKINENDLNTFCCDNTLLPAHPSSINNEQIIFSTGSLGHGPSLSSGLAMAAKFKNKDKRHIYCLCSDGEWQEGSCWEALIFSVHHKLNNMTILIDQNRLQGFGTTQDIVSYSDLTSRIEKFGAHVQTVNGHNFLEIKKALENKDPEKPNIIILNTQKGKSLHFENKLESHYLPLSQEQYATAVATITVE